MKALLKRIVGKLARSERGWRFSKATFLRLADFLHNERRMHTAPPAVDYLSTVRQVFPDLTVHHGPFRGLRYAQARAAGSLLFPKLLGCYERELQDVIEKLCLEPFTAIVDVGCAEGYYAVGLALRLPHAQVYAFDILPEAQQLCVATTAANGVTGRVHVHGRCDPPTLRILLEGAEKALIVVDCEGFEIELLTPEVIAAAARHTFLVETHDMMNLSISRALRDRFAATHHVQSIKSIDDVQKVFDYDYPELAPFSPEARRELISEYRGSIMEWLVFTPLVTATVPAPSPPTAG